MASSAQRSVEINSAGYRRQYVQDLLVKNWLVGIFVGTYSSIYVASASALALGVSKEDLMPVEKEGANLDDMP